MKVDNLKEYFSLSGMLLEDTTLSSGMETLIISGVDAATELLIFANNIEE